MISIMTDKTSSRQIFFRSLVLILGAFFLSACTSGSNIKQSYPVEQRGRYYQNKDETPIKGKLFGDEGGLIKGKKKRRDGSGGIGVNGYLWRASLDTVSFMPLKSADPFGGVIITDWYISDKTPNERLKLTVYILDRRLRADAVRVSVFKQRRRGGWRDAPVGKDTARKIENQILTRARQLRISQIN